MNRPITIGFQNNVIKDIATAIQTNVLPPGIIENIIGNIYSPFIFIKIYIIIVYPKIRPNPL